MISKGALIQMIANEVGVHSMQNGGSGVSQFVKIEECPETVRHACVMGGISYLPKQIYGFGTDYGVVQVPYYFCNTCGKLFIYSEFM